MTDTSEAWAAHRSMVQLIADRIGEWQGIPISVEDFTLVLHDRHPLRDFFRSVDGVNVDVIVGGPTLDEDDDEQLVNHWFSHGRNADVYVFRKKKSGKSFAVTMPRSPDGSLDRLTLWLGTLGASLAWDENAERQARFKLCKMLRPHQWRQYDLTGSFLEASPRSGLSYLFRRSRPTVVLTPRWRFGKPVDSMRVLAVLCMHPIGYYELTWAGCLVPSDDVIAHLSFMRADEAGFWKVCNQHEPWRPEAGL